MNQRGSGVHAALFDALFNAIPSWSPAKVLAGEALRSASAGPGGPASSVTMRF
jgi:hypothetical protein